MRSLAVRRGEVRLAARTFGRRGPHLVLIHGLASTQHIWDLVIPLLERDFRVATYDQRGHGSSSRPRSYGFDAVCADLGAVLTRIGARRPVLVGHSYGANVSIEFASRHPRRVAGVMSVDGAMGSMSEFMSWPDAEKTLAPPPRAGMHVDELMEMIREDVGKPWSPELETIARSLFFVDRRGRVKPRLSRANHMRILRRLYDQRPKELLAAIERPVLMYMARPRAHGMEQERAWYEMKRSSVKPILASNPRIRVEWITSIHDIPIDRPRELAVRIARFAREEARA